MKWLKGQNAFSGIALAALVGAILCVALGAAADRGSIVGAGAGLATLSAVLFALWQFRRQDEDRLSHTYLEAALRAYRLGYEVLSTEAPSRVSWLKAARLLARGMEAQAKISNDEHRNLFGIEIEDLRIKIGDTLRDRPLEFFFCVPGDDLPESADTRVFEAAIRAHPVRSSSGLHLNSTSHELDYMSANAIYTIFEAARFPEGYDNPLLQAPDDFEDRLMGRAFVALDSFLTFFRVYRVNVGNRAVERIDNEQEVYRSSSLRDEEL